MTEDDIFVNESPFNVLQVNKLYYPQVGGIETVVQDIAEGLAAKGHTSRVLAAVPQGRGRRKTYDGVVVRRVASLGRFMSVPLAPTFPVRLWQEAQDADIVHHHLPNPLGVVAHHMTPSREGPTVATYHSDIVRQATTLEFYEPLLRSFLRDADRILVTSPRLLDHSEYLTPHTEKCTVVPLSIELDAYERSPTDTYWGTSDTIESLIDSGRPLILFVGRLNYYKGVEYLIDAMADVDASLLIVGDGERRSDLQTRVRDRGLTDRVTFAGHVAESTLHHCYERADVFVLPSVEPSEAFGIVQLEAMAYETPVVNTNLPTGVPWVSQDGETGLTVEPRDSDALADAINTLLADETLRRTYGEQARKRVVATFSREQMLADVESVYQKLFPA